MTSQFTLGPPEDNEEGSMYSNTGQNLNDGWLNYGHQLTTDYEDPDIDLMNDVVGENRRRDGNEDEDDDEDDDDGSNDYDTYKQVIVGICAMEKKAQSKPMKEILRRLEDYFEYIKTLIFEESVILNKAIEDWPLCDCLISFHSKGFPLSKAIEYARLRRPFLVNDLDIQYDIQDRRKVYKILEEADIELPRYAVLDRDSSNPEERELVESDDHIEVSNFVFNKPFVEKPISAEDHNICIYYPAHAGGGSQRLFRKIGCRSSVYSNESHVRKTGSYIYEEFMPTDGTDVKVYTAGPDYAHAEARKSPALDGKVERDRDGKEIRYPVILTNREKLIARRVCLAFKQTICGFDLLRANGKSYVCDVNGFSFVKSSMKYYEDCSKILGNMMLRALAPQLHIPWSIPFQLDDPPIVPTTFGRMMELRCVIAVIRHGDRTPKQKMKLEVKHSKFFELYHKYGKNGQAKLKKPKQLQEVLDIARYLLGELPDQPSSGEVIAEPRVKLRQLKSVLEMYGHFSGINRKVQLKYQPHGRPRRSSSEDDCAREPSLVLILKWGGELTPAGRVQAEDLGRCFRRLYPASGDYSGPQGLGLLRLHSTFRHDLKIYASDEGRVQMTAAAFAKGFLALEGELTPILFQMVKSANTNGLLDNDCESGKCQKIVKERLHTIMLKNQELSGEDIEILNPTSAPSIESACNYIKNPYQACEKVHKLIKDLNTLIKTKRQDNGYTQEYHLYHGETWDLLQRRWAKLEKDFKMPRSKRFDISKIPDIYDCIKYDLQHNQHTLQFQSAHELYTYAKALADIVIPQEYGMTSQEKLMISLGTCSPLLRKIQADLLRNADSANEDETESVNRLDPKYSHGVSSPDRHVRTRLYFTSESHIHSLVTALQYGGLLDLKRDEQWRRSMEFLAAISELNYLSQIVIMLYEDPTKEPTASDRFHVEIHFSSGVINRITQSQNMPTEPQGPGFRPHMHNKSYSNASDNDSNHQQMKVSEQQQQQQDSSSIIREEQTDDERSTTTTTADDGSRANSKSSSVCLTPGKLNSPNNSSAAASTATAAAMEETGRCELATGETDTLTQASVSKLASSHRSQNRLSRSYSAVAPVSLQNLFKKPSEDKERQPFSEEDVQTTIETDSPNRQHASDADGPKLRDNQAAATDELPAKSHAPITRQTATAVASESLESSYEDDRTPTSESPNQSAASVSSGRLTHVGCSIESSCCAATPLSFSQSIESTRRAACQRSAAPRVAKTTRTRFTSSSSSNEADKLPSLLGSDCLSQTPHPLRCYQQQLQQNTRAGRYQHHLQQHHQHHLHHLQHLQHLQNLNQSQSCNSSGDQSAAAAAALQLPPTYHTVHHVSFSPQTLTSLATAGSGSSPPMATPSPTSCLSGGVGLQQRYLAHKQHQQQQINKQQFFTLSASMPIHYKHNTNPRACSVADVSQYCGGPSSLISTAVISGSSPELVAVCPYSPTIRPLETLHNELSLRQFSDFIYRLTRNQRQQSAAAATAANVTTTATTTTTTTTTENGKSTKVAPAAKPVMNDDGGQSSDNQVSCSSSLAAATSHQQRQHTNARAASQRRRDSTGQGTTRGALSLNFSPVNNSNNNATARGDQQQRETSSSAMGSRQLSVTGSANQPFGCLSPGNSLSNSLIWGYLSSSSPGVPSSPSSAALELWTKLELNNDDDDDDDEQEKSENNEGACDDDDDVDDEQSAAAVDEEQQKGDAVTESNQLSQGTELGPLDSSSSKSIEKIDGRE